jgi:hypothetical protein
MAEIRTGCSEFQRPSEALAKQSITIEHHSPHSLRRNFSVTAKPQFQVPPLARILYNLAGTISKHSIGSMQSQW